MSDSFLLDSSVLIYVLDQRPAVVALLHQIDELERAERPAISAITVYEVLAGANPTEQERTVDFLSVFEVIPVTDGLAARAAAMAQLRRERGLKPAIADTIIAATAIARDKTLVTYDQRHFARLGVDLYQEMPALD